jgi:nucleoside-diphosphate-sugar epimerase
MLNSDFQDYNHLPTYDKTVLVTGATGLIGSFVVRLLLQQGATIHALRRQSSTPLLLEGLDEQIHWHEGDVLDVDSLEAAMEGVQSVIHCAATVSFHPRDHAHMFKVNVEGTANVVNVALTTGIEDFCFVSSVAALGRKKGQMLIDESNQWEASPLNSQYAQSKHLAEMEVWRGIAEGLSAVIVNPSVVLGPGELDKSSTQLFNYVYTQKPFYIDGYLNYVDVRDVATSILLLLARQIRGERFVVSAGTITYLEMFGYMAETLGKKAPRIKVNGRMAGIAWRLASLQSWFTGGRPFITRETAQIAQNSFTFDNQKIKKRLDYQFKSAQEAIQWTGQALLAREKNPKA